jgi:hypothetical protein
MEKNGEVCFWGAFGGGCCNGIIARGEMGGMLGGMLGRMGGVGLGGVGLGGVVIGGVVKGAILKLFML